MNRRFPSFHRPMTRRSLARFLVAALVFMAFAGIGGYFLATSRDAAVLSRIRSDIDAAHYQVLAATDESLSLRIERINIEQQAREQAQVILQLKGEVDGVQKSIVDALT